MHIILGLPEFLLAFPLTDEFKPFISCFLQIQATAIIPSHSTEQHSQITTVDEHIDTTHTFTVLSSATRHTLEEQQPP